MVKGEVTMVDEENLRKDLMSPRFLSGEDRGRWKLRELRWPYLFVDLVATKLQQNYTLRLNCTNYPSDSPTGGFWDMENERVLAAGSWPRGSSRVGQALNPSWQGGTALYIPCDRVSMAGHDPWRTQYPQQLWNSERGITMYLEIVHELLEACH